MTTLTLEFDGVYEKIINAMLRSKMAKTKSEAVRMALLNFGLNIGSVKNKTILESIRKDLSKDALSVDEIGSRIRKTKDETVHR